MNSTLWESPFESASSAWKQLNAVPTAWEAAFEEAAAACRKLVRSGCWFRGGTDLLSIVGRHHQEAVHSAAIAWLLDPAGSHGLEDRFLVRFLLAAGLRDVAAMIESEELGSVEALVSTEVSLEHDEAAGRVDIKVDVAGHVLIIENKVNAAEHGNQLHRYRVLAERHHDLVGAKQTILILLALAPRQRLLDEAEREGFLTLTYRDGVRRPLTQALAKDCVGPGRPAALEYLRTIERMTS